jgi:hypothetical protein
MELKKGILSFIKLYFLCSMECAIYFSFIDVNDR